MCRVDYGDGYSAFSSTSFPKAKKHHRCNECSRIIVIGENYEKNSGKYDGDMFTHKMCAHCSVAAKLLIKKCDGYVYGEVFEDLEEHIGYEYKWDKDARRLCAGMRKKWMFNGKLLNIPQLKTTGVDNIN